MCGRISLSKSADTIAAEFTPELWPDRDQWEPTYNLAPTQRSPVLLDEGQRAIRLMRWGLIPFWAKDRGIAGKLINARAETITEKPSFRHLVERRRCAVIAHGYFEWRKGPGRQKSPFFIHREDGRLLTLAALWDTWEAPDGATETTYTIVTTAAAESLASLHHRMPVVLPDEASRRRWLTVTPTTTADALDLLQPREPSLTFFQVSTFVNSTHNDSPACIERVDNDFLL